MTTYYRTHPLTITPSGYNTNTCIEKLDDEVDLLLQYLNALHDLSVPPGTWAVFYQDGDGASQRLALGAAGKMLVSQGAAAAPVWGDPPNPVTCLKGPARVATTANLVATYDSEAMTLTNNDTLEALTLDAVALDEDDLVLVKDQTTGTQNGLYRVTTVGSNLQAWVLTRADTANTSALMEPGFLVAVTEGTANNDSIWMLSTNAPITLDTTALVFVHAGKPHGVEIFTSSGTFTVPAGVTKVYVSLCGGGGGGGRGNAYYGGGGAQAYLKEPVSVTPGAEITVTIGSGGTGKASTDGNGTAGGTSSFGALLSAAGGASASGAAGGAGGAAGLANVTAYVKYNASDYVDCSYAGAGGGCLLGNGGAPVALIKQGLGGHAYPAISGGEGGLYGGGGGGSIGGTGANGANGVCIVEW